MQSELDNSSAMTVSNSASGEPSVSSSGQPPPPPAIASKRKRNLPGTPDPNSEVIALSPKTLMATNRFVCEICGKGFQRDQNLQLHRRGHNLPWKLRQRSQTAARKRVYVCPEPTCVHHDPSRALGDLTGIKKHFSRKHGEKKYKCEKCSKKYAVQSDWKAHSKTCGTREYRCDCGTLFSRRDSFITHRAFCDALAEESAKAKTGVKEEAPPPPLAESETGDDQKTVELVAVSPVEEQPVVAMEEDEQHLQQKEPDNPEPAAIPDQIPPPPPPPPPPSPPLITANNSNNSSSRNISSNCSGSSTGAGTSVFASLFASASTTQTSTFSDLIGANTAAARPTSLCLFPSETTFQQQFLPLQQHQQQPPSPHLSATALLQKAAQMGATATNTSLLRSFGLAATTSTSSLQENHQWPGLGLGLSYNGGHVLPDLVMGGPPPVSLFGQRPATLDFLGLGMGLGGPPAGGFSALITSMGSGGGLDVAAASFGGAGKNSSALGKAAWESAGR